jgi:hypothetical protein
MRSAIMVIPSLEPQNKAQNTNKVIGSENYQNSSIAVVLQTAEYGCDVWKRISNKVETGRPSSRNFLDSVRLQHSEGGKAEIILQ